jgi:hypothetical protein
LVPDDDGRNFPRALKIFRRFPRRQGANTGDSPLDAWHVVCVCRSGDASMTENTFELPLAFDGHVARLVVTRPAPGVWHVETQVDGRVLGWEQFTGRAQVDRFRARMQQWLAHAAASERRAATTSADAMRPAA